MFDSHTKAVNNKIKVVQRIFVMIYGPWKSWMKHRIITYNVTTNLLSMDYSVLKCYEQYLKKYHCIDIWPQLNIKVHDTEVRNIIFRKVAWNFLPYKENTYTFITLQIFFSKALMICVTKNMKNEYNNNKLNIHIP